MDKSYRGCVDRCGEEFDNYYDCLIDCLQVGSYEGLEPYPSRTNTSRKCFSKCRRECRCEWCECMDECLLECLS